MHWGKIQINFQIDDTRCGIQNSIHGIRQKSFEYEIKDEVTLHEIQIEMAVTVILVLGTSIALCLVTACYLHGKTKEPCRKEPSE